MTKSEKRVHLIKQMQDELDRRTKIEKDSEQLMCEGKYKEAKELLDALDDSIIRGIGEELDKLGEAEEEKMAQSKEEVKEVRNVSVLNPTTAECSLRDKLMADITESGLAYREAISAISYVQAVIRDKGSNLLNGINIQEVVKQPRFAWRD